jgi:hypothetical protein
MTKLTDTQIITLSAAASRDSREVLPLPDSLKGGAAHKVVGALLSRGLIEEAPAHVAAPVWRTDDGGPVLLRITAAGLDAIGIDPAPEGSDAQVDAGATEAAPKAAPAPTGRTPREGTKQAALIAMLRSPDGATIAEVVAATGWQAHTVRGAMAGALKKKLGLEVTSEKIEGRGRVYRLPPA